jgi:branched-chain amino acid transport system permease protein
MFWFAVSRLDTWTGGEDGLTGIKRLAVGIPGLFQVPLQDNLAFYYFVYALFVVLTIVIYRIVRSPFGQVIQAIKQSESRASALGYDTARYKWAVFTLSCAFAGFAGGLYSLARFGAFPEPMSLHQSGNVVLMCLVGGGFASFYGPVLGVAVFLVLRDFFSTLTDHWMLLYGLLFMAIILFLPEGILGLVQRRRGPVSAPGFRARTSRRPTTARPVHPSSHRPPRTQPRRLRPWALCGRQRRQSAARHRDSPRRTTRCCLRRARATAGPRTAAA